MMQFNHIGFTVTDIEAAIKLYESLGFQLTRRFEKPEPRAHVASMQDGNGAGLELWQFTDEHPLKKYIGRHTAFICDDVRRVANELLESGFKEVIPFTEGVILDYIFVQDEHGLVYELAQEKQ